MSKALVSKTTPTFFEPSQAGKSLKEIGTDYLKVESKNIVSRWFHSTHDVDLFLWLDEHSQVIKQQVSFCGQIVEWNILDGLKTGVVVEEELQTEETLGNKIDQSEIIRFDEQPQKQAIQLAVEVVQNIETIEDLIRNNMLVNFGLKIKLFQPVLAKVNGTENVSSQSLWQRFLKFFNK